MAISTSSLAPGFRFHPTDEELVRYYLRRKVCGKSFRFDAISDVEVYKVEPWDLPGLSRLKTRDLEWYFFSVLDKKYGNGSRTNRATDRGYWKTTGKDRAVHHRSQPVGMKKTLVYHNGRAPKGERTNWVMHEYRLIDQELANAGIAQDAFVLCRIFHKSGSGPKIGEKYGASFVEEEWEEDELVFAPKHEGFAEELPVDEDSYLDANDIEQILGTGMAEEDGLLPSDLCHSDKVNSADVSTQIVNPPQKLLVGVGEDEPQADTNDGSKLFDLPVQNGTDLESIKHELLGSPSNTMNFDMDYLLDEPYFDANSGDFLLDEGLFFEANDLDNAMKTDAGLDMINEYTSFFDPSMDNLQCTFDSLGSKNILQDNVNEGTRSENDGSSSKQEHPILATDIAYPFLKKASSMLGSISAPPAFAAEFPTKYLASASQDSSSAHVTTGMIRVRDVSFSGSTVDWSLDKHTHVNIVLSFGLGQTDAHPHQVVSFDSSKANAAVSRSWFYCIFLWILILSLMCFKIGTIICPRSVMN